MNQKIKQMADNRDIKSLKYIFVDSLDVDPTFESYEEEYNYCKSIPGLLERHKELTPFVIDPSSWNEAYWTRLKMDLVENFSDQRMTHMRKVAQGFLARKIEQIRREREKAAQAASAKSPQKPQSTVDTHKISPEESVPSQRPTKWQSSSQSSAESQSKREEREMQEEINRANAEAEANMRADRERIERMRRQYAATGANSGTSSKKALGIVAAAVVVVAVILLVLALRSRNP